MLTDTDVLLMLEKVICGGITPAAKGYAKDNNKYKKDQYNLDETNNIWMKAIFGGEQ